MLKQQEIGIGTWILAGCFYGGVEELEVVATLHDAIDRGIQLIDTAPLYGFGKTEEIVGRAIRARRDQVFLATKFGLGWNGGNLYRDARGMTIRQEIDNSLRRLQTDHVDLYQLHWPDPLTPVGETAEALCELLDAGKIGAVGLSNVSLKELKEFEAYLPIAAVQLPLNLFEKGIERDLLPYCLEKKIAVLGYSALCRGLLTGTLTRGMKFRNDDVCSFDPKFKEPVFSKYLACSKKMSDWTRNTQGRSLIDLSIRWSMAKGVIPLWGPANRAELLDLESLKEWQLNPAESSEVEQIVEQEIPHPIGVEFLTPPTR